MLRAPVRAREALHSRHILVTDSLLNRLHLGRRLRLIFVPQPLGQIVHGGVTHERLLPHLRFLSTLQHVDFAARDGARREDAELLEPMEHLRVRVADHQRGALAFLCILHVRGGLRNGDDNRGVRVVAKGVKRVRLEVRVDGRLAKVRTVVLAGAVRDAILRPAEARCAEAGVAHRLDVASCELSFAIGPKVVGEPLCVRRADIGRDLLLVRLHRF